jgi:hypothetical protein
VTKIDLRRTLRNEGVDTSGMTDQDVVNEVIRRINLAGKEIDAAFDRIAEKVGADTVRKLEQHIADK